MNAFGKNVLCESEHTLRVESSSVFNLLKVFIQKRNAVMNLNALTLFI